MEMSVPPVSFPLVGVTTWKLEIRLQVRKLLKSEGRRESRDRLERQKSQEKRRRRRQKREERDSEEGHQLGEKDLEERGRAEVLKQPRAFCFFYLNLNRTSASVSLFLVF